MGKLRDRVMASIVVGLFVMFPVTVLAVLALLVFGYATVGCP